MLFHIFLFQPSVCYSNKDNISSFWSCFWLFSRLSSSESAFKFFNAIRFSKLSFFCLKNSETDPRKNPSAVASNTTINIGKSIVKELLSPRKFNPKLMLINCLLLKQKITSIIDVIKNKDIRINRKVIPHSPIKSFL